MHEASVRVLPGGQTSVTGERRAFTVKVDTVWSDPVSVCSSGADVAGVVLDVLCLHVSFYIVTG